MERYSDNKLERFDSELWHLGTLISQEPGTKYLRRLRSQIDKVTADWEAFRTDVLEDRHQLRNVRNGYRVR